MKKTKWFKLYELLPREEYVNEETGWGKIDDKLKETLDAVREILGVPLICNNWKSGGSRNNCGLRAQNCKIGAVNSAHKQGMAVDLISSKMTAATMRTKLLENAHNLPHPIRIENSVNWLHVDTKAKVGYKIYFFNP